MAYLFSPIILLITSINAVVTEIKNFEEKDHVKCIKCSIRIGNKNSLTTLMKIFRKICQGKQNCLVGLNVLSRGPSSVQGISIFATLGHERGPCRVPLIVRWRGNPNAMAHLILQSSG